MVDKKLGIYMNDHLAGSTLALELVRRSQISNRDNEFGEFLSGLLAELQADRAQLETVMQSLGVTPNPLKQAVAWVGEKVGRLKLNGEVTRYSDLSRLIEFEALVMGIQGKRSLWESLLQAKEIHPELEQIDLVGLRQRAESQLTRTNEFKAKAAEVLLSASRP